MKSYTVTFQETTSWFVTVQAADVSEADALAWKKFNSVDRSELPQDYSETTSTIELINESTPS
jgi:hypothetical protein